MGARRELCGRKRVGTHEDHEDSSSAEVGGWFREPGGFAQETNPAQIARRLPKNPRRTLRRLVGVKGAPTATLRVLRSASRAT